MVLYIFFVRGFEILKSGFNCPICCHSSKYFFTKYGYRIQRCLNCEHQFLEGSLGKEHVINVYNDSYFQGGGAGYPNYISQRNLLIQHGHRYGKILDKYISPGKVLDVGAASGFILQGLIDSGWMGDGIEPNDEMAHYGRVEMGLPISTGSLESLNDVKEDDSYDLISMIQVIPHFFDLHRALTAASALTRSGGFWLIETWNRESITARLLGQHWHEYSPPSVLRWFALSDLTKLASHYGFEMVASGRPSKWIRASHAKSLLKFKFQDMGFLGQLMSKLLALIPSKLSIPYPSEDLIWILYKKTD